MRIGNNVYGSMEFYTKLTPELIDNLRTQMLLGGGEKSDRSKAVTFRVSLPTYRTKPGKKREKLHVDYFPQLSVYNYRVYKQTFPKNGHYEIWEVTLW